MAGQPSSPPQLLLLATGGTIAGRGASSTSLNAYTAGAMSGSELLQELPQLQELVQRAKLLKQQLMVQRLVSNQFKVSWQQLNHSCLL